MIPLVSIVLFLLGAIVASFVGVLVARLHTGQSFLKGRSRCDACSTPLSFLALVPIISFSATRGRARCCGARISLLSPITELLLGALFVLAYAKLGFAPALPCVLIAVSLLLALVLYDLKHQILPPTLLALFVAASALTGFLSSYSLADFFDSSLVALGIAASLALVHYVSRGRAMGFSDAPLVLGLSFLVGDAAFPGFVFSFWIGAVIGIFILLSRPPGSRMGVEVPLAPYLAAGYLFAYFTQWNPFAFAALLFIR